MINEILQKKIDEAVHAHHIEIDEFRRETLVRLEALQDKIDRSIEESIDEFLLPESVREGMLGGSVAAVLQHIRKTTNDSFTLGREVPTIVKVLFDIALNLKRISISPHLSQLLK